MTRRRAVAGLLALVGAALAWSAAVAPSAEAEGHCHGSRHCQTPRPGPADPGSTALDSQAAQTANPATATPQDSQPAAPGPVVGVVSTPAGLQSVRVPTAAVPAPRPAGDLTLPILLVILGLSVIAVVTFVLALSVA